MCNNEKTRQRPRRLEDPGSLVRTKNQLRDGLRWGPVAAVCLTYAVSNCGVAKAAVIANDTLETAVAAPPDLIGKDDFFDVFAAGKYLYDDNVYRLSAGVTNLQTLNGIGPHPSRQDHINSASVGIDGQWSSGRQMVVVDLSAEENRFVLNDNLNNTSNNDKVVWNWNVAGLLSGQIGATYNSGLAGFVNATVYSRNIIETTSYFGSARYQLGPHWAIFGGVIDSGSTLTAGASQANDGHSKSVEFGTEFVVSLKDTLGGGYRYTDAGYPPTLQGNGDFREDIAYIYDKHAFSEKTSIDGSVGYLKRDYANSSIGSFSGDIWSVSLQWSPTEKLQFRADGWRRLQAYLTAQSDYFVSKGGSIAPSWTASEKVVLSLLWSLEDQDYVPGPGQIPMEDRRDTLNVRQANLAYTPTHFLKVEFAYGYEKRNSNMVQYSYNDLLASAKVTVKY
jgi:hypothetical protein